MALYDGASITHLSQSFLFLFLFLFSNCKAKEVDVYAY
jgi:hypothetical protein